MKEWWIQLSLKEKKMVAGCGVLVAFFLFSELIFSPIINKSTDLREEIQRNHRLLNWMQDADQRLSKLSLSSLKATSQKTSLLSLVQTEMQQHDFSSSVSALQQTENNTVQLRLQKVDFDKIIQWLTIFCGAHAVKITQLSVHTSEASGIVDMELKLQN